MTDPNEESVASRNDGGAKPVDEDESSIAYDPLPPPTKSVNVEEDNGDSSEKNGGEKGSSSSRRFRLTLASIFSDEEEGNGCCAKMKRGEGRCGSCMFRWPRTCACCCGVVVPLWVLIFFTFIFGYSLCKFEAPNEIVLNDDIMQAKTSAEQALDLSAQFAEAVPRVCYGLFLEMRPATQVQQELDRLFDDEIIPESLPGPLADVYLSGNVLLVNTTRLYEFMVSCGAEAVPIAEKLGGVLTDVADIAGEDLTFNWIRCIPSSNGLDDTDDLFKRHSPDVMMYSEQEAHYQATWTADQQEIFNQTYAQLLDEGYTPFDAKRAAFNISITQATGESGCSLNPVASTWFWFTVMTTVGYGNQAPETTGGRGLVYSIGFLNILCFGGILAVAGYIVSSVSDDAAHRFRLHVLTRPWVSSVIWGSLYYTWMLGIAGYTLKWKRERLGVPNAIFDFADSYWFAYISTTTVGLGDYYLEPEVIIWTDLITFPLLFLVGFTYLASFLGKFSAALWNTFVGEGHTSYVEILLAQLPKTNMVPDTLAVQEVGKLATDVGLKPFEASDDDEIDEKIAEDEVPDEFDEEKKEKDKAEDPK